MPMFLPVIIAFAGVASGVVTGFAAYAAIAGAVLTTAGALTGNKDLMRIGAVVGVVGGIAGFASGAASGAEAVSGMDLAADAGTGANSVGTAAGAVDAAQAAGEVGSAAGVSSNVVAPPSTAPPAPVAVAPPDAVTTAPTAGGTSLADVAAKNASTIPVSTAATTPADAMSSYQALENQAASPLSKAASNYTSSDLSSWWDKAMAAGKTAGKTVLDFTKQNPELVKIGGQVLMAMNDPQAEALEYQKSLMEQARRNINSPVVLGYNKPK